MARFYTNEASFNDLHVSGSTIMSASSGITTRILGSGSTVLSVSGSTNEILNVSDINSPSIFSVSSATGDTILDISSTAPYLFSVSRNNSDIFAISASKEVLMFVSGTANTKGLKIKGIPLQSSSYILTYSSESGVVGYTSALTSSYPINVTGSTLYSIAPLSTNRANTTQSIFLGLSAGDFATSSSYSVLMGYKAGYITSSTSIGSNNIIIGTNITLPVNRCDSINIGGILFGSGSYSTITNTNTSSYSGSVNGRIGINVVSPNYTLEISGSGPSGSLDINDVLYVSSSRVGIGILNPLYNLDVSGIARINDIMKLERRTTNPTSPEEGMIIASGSTGSSKLYYYDGTIWNPLF